MTGSNNPASVALDYFVYVLRNDAGVTYTGIAKDVEARFAKHNANMGARFTRGRGPWAVAYLEGPYSRGEALRRERRLRRDRRFKAEPKAQFAED